MSALNVKVPLAFVEEDDTLSPGHPVMSPEGAEAFEQVVTTFQVPTRFPPQGDTFPHEPAALFELPLHAPKATSEAAKAAPIHRFIDLLPSKWGKPPLALSATTQRVSRAAQHVLRQPKDNHRRPLGGSLMMAPRPGKDTVNVTVALRARRGRDHMRFSLALGLGLLCVGGRLVIGCAASSSTGTELPGESTGVGTSGSRGGSTRGSGSSGGATAGSSAGEVSGNDYDASASGSVSGGSTSGSGPSTGHASGSSTGSASSASAGHTSGSSTGSTA